MRHRSPRNSRRHENKALVAAYREQNPRCELHLFPHVPGGVHGAEINHLFSQRKRWDLLSNIIHLSVEAHRWFHEYPIDGRVACLWVKMQKDEIDGDEIKLASGMYLAGWLSSKKPVFEWASRLRDELMSVYN